MTHKIEELDQRQHILLRPNMYIGATTTQAFNDYVDGQLTELNYIPALVKIINEIIDNSVDIAIKTDFKGCNAIEVKINDDSVEVIDNGTGIPITKNDKGIFLPKVCWGTALSGSNFSDDNHVQIGTNGIGSYCTNVWSKKFIGISDDGKYRYRVTFTDNASKSEEALSESRSHGVGVKFYPDLERFNIDKISDTIKSVIKQRIINLNLCFPKIKFKFNGKQINVDNFKKYISAFNKNFEIYETDNYQFAILPSSSDEFQYYSYVNGLKLSDGGQHIDNVSNEITKRLRDKLERKFKNIKPADIKNKLFIIMYMRNFNNPKFNSQTKEKLTNSIAEVNEYLGNVDYDNLCKKILKNNSIIDPIVEVFKVKEELKRRQELKSLEKPPKKIKDEHYLSATKEKKYIFIVEGQSALSGLVPCLGREQCGYFTLKGKPLNAWEVSQQKFTANKELSSLYQVIKNESRLEDKKDGKWYLFNKNNKSFIVNENDTITIDNTTLNITELELSPITPTKEQLEEYKNNKHITRRKFVASGYQHIVYATDQDLDGFHIRALLSGFVKRYLSDYEDMIGMLETPVVAVFKNGKIQKWTYSLDDKLELKQGENSFYYKGLGSWNKDDFKIVLAKDGIDKMIEKLDFNNSENNLNDWLGSDSEPRKKSILANNFSIADI